jgi:hypothetical protein
MASFRPSAQLNLRVTTNRIERDRTQRREPLALRMYATLQVPLAGETQSDDVEGREIPISIDYFDESAEFQVYEPCVFISAFGSFEIISGELGPEIGQTGGRHLSFVSFVSPRLMWKIFFKGLMYLCTDISITCADSCNYYYIQVGESSQYRCASSCLSKGSLHS